MMATTKKKILKWATSAVKAGVTIGLLWWVIDSVGLNDPEGMSQFLDGIFSANIFILVLAVAFVPIMDFVSTIKWHMLVKYKHVSIGFWKLFAFYVVGRFFNMILPSSVGGDLIRIHLLGKETGQLASSAAIVFIERVTGLIMLVALTAGALLMAAGSFSQSWVQWLVLVAALGLAMIVLAFMVDGFYQFFVSIFKGLHPFIEKIFNKIDKMRSTIVEIGKNRNVLTLAFLNSFIFYIVAILNAWVSILVFDLSVPLTTMIIAVPIIMFLMNLPVSIGSLGIMEFSYTAVLSAFGIDPVVALSLALLMRLKLILAAGMGAITYQFVSLKISDPQKLKQELSASNAKSS